MEVIVSFAILIAFLGTVYPMKDLPTGSMEMVPGIVGVEHMSLNYSVKPLSEVKDKNIVKQEYDYSCGSAALATLLNFYLGEGLSEQQVIQGMMQFGEAEKIQKRRAFSLLDMKRFTEVLGYEAAGYKAEIRDLNDLKKPAIVPIEFYGYKHFVVFRGFYGDHVFVADPFMGNMSYTTDKFIELWNPTIVFVVSDGEVKTNALKLKEEDLRVVDLDMTEKAVTQAFPHDLLKSQREFRESLGTTVFRTLKIYD